MSEFETDILTQLVRARYTCLTQLRDMGRRQLELIERRNVTALLDVLAAKQRPLADIQRIERALDPFRSQDPEQRRWRTPADRAACAELVRQCDALLREIGVQERRCEELMTEQRDEIAVRLQQFRAAGQAHGAYAALARVDATQIDLFSET
jgi:hypothetical protein